MRNATFAAAICITFLATSAHAAKLTTDPNAPGGATPPTVAKPADPRLDAKVTYESGYKRLHAVTDDLTALTHVKIYAGSSPKDWPVRDIPLVVCVTDLSLGKLLNAIAESTHTTLSSATLESKEIVYRLFRTKRAEALISAKLKTARENHLELASWSWDAIVSLAKNPAAQKEMAADKPPDMVSLVAAVGKLLDSLGSDAKGRVMSGETLSISGSSTPQKAMVRDLYMAHWEHASHNQPADRDPLKKPTDEALNAAVLTLHLRDGGESGVTGVWAEMPMTNETTGRPFLFPLALWPLDLDKLKSLKLPPQPANAVAEEDTDHPTDPKLLAVAKPEDWASEKLGKKVTLKRPAGNDYLAFSDVITALAKAAEINVVTEDFLSQHFPWEIDERAFGHSTTLEEVLKPYFCSWFFNETDDLLVGWISGNGVWRKRHRNLVPESFFDTMLSKRDKGLGLDDVIPVAGLTPEQRQDWIRANRYVPWLTMAFHKDLPLWQLYNAVSEHDKVLAMGGEGLRLGRLDSVWVAAFLRDRTEVENAAGFAHRPISEDKRPADITPLFAPKVVDTAVMRVKQVPATARVVIGLGPKRSGMQCAFPEIHYSYVVEVEYRDGDRTATIISTEPGMALPIYTWRREMELYKAFIDAGGKPQE